MSSEVEGHLGLTPPLEWPHVLLDEVASEITVGHVGPMAHRYVDDGIPFLRSQNVRPLKIDTDDLKYIPESFHTELRKSRLQPGDVVIVRTGSPGSAAAIPGEIPDANCADLVIVRPGPKLLPRFLAYVVNSVAKSHIAAHTVGAVQQHFNVGSARSLGFRLPPLAEQERIVAVLGSIDDKVESNERAVEALRDILTLVARHSSGVDTPMDTVARFRNGGALTKLADGDGRPILRIKELRTGVSGETPRMSAAVRAENEVTFGDLLFSWSGTLLTTRWDGDDAVLNQHIFRVDPNRGIPTWLVEGWIEQHLPYFRSIAADKKTTMGHIQRRHLTEATVKVPDEAALADLDARYTPLDALSMGLLRESRCLGTIRDELLPKLVSGKIRVPAAEEIVEAGDDAALGEAAA